MKLDPFIKAAIHFKTGLPSSYMVLDTETTGFHPSTCAVLDYGMVMVKDREVVSSFSQYIKRPEDMLKRGAEAEKVHKITPEKLEREGVEPDAFIPDFMRMINAYVRGGGLVVGYNFLNFDMGFFQADAAAHGVEFEVKEEDVFDLGLMMKAALFEITPITEETLHEYCARVNRVYGAKGQKWNLKFASETLKIEYDKSKLHGAEMDCKVCHMIIENIRTQIEELTHA